MLLLRYLPFVILIAFCNYAKAVTMANGEEKVLVISNTSIDPLTIAELRALFSLQRRMLPSNRRVQIVVLLPTIKASNTFSQELFNYYPYQLQRLWDREVFSGRARAPLKLTSSREVLDYVANNEDAIGYVEATKNELKPYADTVNVVLSL